MQNKFLCFIIVCFCLIEAGCFRQANKNFTVTEARQSYLEGDTIRAYQLSELLAFQNDPEAQYALGYMHYYGIGAPQNQKLAIAWFKHACQHGSQPAKVALTRIAKAQGLDSIEALQQQYPN